MSPYKKQPKSELLKTANEQTVQMLVLCEAMFEMVTRALAHETPPTIMAEIKKMDKEINHLHRDVRRKVFQHLAISDAREIYPSLILLSVVDDTERVGDYNKNIADVVTLMPKKMDFGPYTERFNEVWESTTEFFAATFKAFRDDDEDSASFVLAKYGRLSDLCDDVVDEILTGPDEAGIRRDLVALVLLMRFFKRVDAHLKNIASAIVNPFHRIGYKPLKAEAP